MPPDTARCPICGTPSPSARIGAPDRLHGTPGRYGVAVCPECGTGRTLPPASPAELAAYYPSAYGPYDAKLPPLLRLVSAAIRRRQGAKARRSEPLRALAGRPPGRGVDVGAGRGDLAAMLVARGWRMTGVEPSEAACAAAAERGVDARPGTLQTVALEPGAYDFAVFQHSLEHVEDPVADLRVVRQALRPGGLVLVSVPNFGSWQARAFRGRWYHLDVPRHRVHLTRTGLERALREAGLEPVRFATSTSGVGLPASVQYRVAGRCLFPGGLPLRFATGLAALTWPLARMLDGVAGGGDVLHAVAERPAASR
jgi:SAM-dependent methyltransferase